METSILDTIVELGDSDKDNYNKVIIHKRKCVAYTTTNSVNICEDSRGKESSDDDEHNIYANIRSQSFKIPNDTKSQIINCYPPLKTGSKQRPKVPPKPKNINRVPPTRAVSDPISVKNVKSLKTTTTSQDVIKTDNGNENSQVGHYLTERLIEETKDIVARNLMKEREELLTRMQNNVNLLQDSLSEIKSEIQDNSHYLESFINKIRLDGGIVEADKLKLHMDELDSVTLLKTVLSVRLKTTQNKLELSKELKETEFLNKKSMKLASQISEAEILTKFRNTRGEVILKSLSSYIDQENLKRLKQYLDQRITLQTEMGDVKEKLHMTMRQLEILKI